MHGLSTGTALIDKRGRMRRMVPVIATGIAALIGTLTVRMIDPNVPGHYPSCPSRSLLGIDCAGCGGLRGTYDLLHGDVMGMLDNNVLLACALPAAVVAFLVWARRSWTGRRPTFDAGMQARRTRMWIWVVLAVFAFGLIRNVTPFLGSGPG